MQNRRAMCFGLVAGMAALAAGCTTARSPGTNAGAPGAGRITMVQSVDAVDVQVVSRSPLVVNVAARGTANSGGWSNPRLARGGNVGQDGILELALIAEAPTGGATQALQPIRASDRYDELPPRFRGVRVLAQTNSVTRMIE